MTLLKLCFPGILFSRSQLFHWRNLAIAPLLALSLSQPAMTQEIPLHLLTVTGQGTERIPTSLTQVNLGVEVQGKTAQEAQKEAAQKTTAVIAFLRSQPIEQLETTGIRLQPTYDYQEKQQRLIGYNAINSISFRIKTDQIGSLLDDAVKSGATRIDGLSFTASETAIATAQQAALRLATLDAQKQAETVLKSLSLKAQEVVGIQIGDAVNPSPRPVPLMQEARMVKADFNTPVIGGEQVVRASVTLQIRY
jgi:uncharacterized protein YggE